MAGAVKKATNLTGLRVAENPHHSLRAVYNRILNVLKKMPEDAAYRRHTQKIVTTRLDMVDKEPDVEKLEQKMGLGQVEEVIQQGEREYTLAVKMLEWKPWEPLIGQAPPEQWKWPPV